MFVRSAGKLDTDLSTTPEPRRPLMGHGCLAVLPATRKIGHGSHIAARLHTTRRRIAGQRMPARLPHSESTHGTQMTGRLPDGRRASRARVSDRLPVTRTGGLRHEIGPASGDAADGTRMFGCTSGDTTDRTPDRWASGLGLHTTQPVLHETGSTFGPGSAGGGTCVGWTSCNTTDGHGGWIDFRTGVDWTAVPGSTDGTQTSARLPHPGRQMEHRPQHDSRTQVDRWNTDLSSTPGPGSAGWDTDVGSTPRNRGFG